MNKRQTFTLLRIVLSALLMGILFFIPAQGFVRLLLFLVAYLIIGYDILIKAVKGIISLQPFDENFLMAIATVGAIVLGEYVEGTAVMLFYQIGELFQSYAVGKSRKSIAELMDIRPDYANIEINGEMIQVDPYEVDVGTIITVKAGEKIPIDGVVVEGSSTLNTSALTGESLPRDIFVGDEVQSGSVNMTGLIKIRTSKKFDESTALKILDLVENASSRKSRSENFISKFSRIYTPIVCVSALALALFPPLISLLINTEPQWNQWIYRALTFLVISCPCALVISIPLSFFAGLGGASKEGILIKGSNFIERLSKVKTVVFDKTGTLTEGSFKVQEVKGEDVLEIAAYAESYSNHPISKSIKEAFGKNIDKSKVYNITEFSGYGVTAIMDGKEVAVGNRKLMDKLNIEFCPLSLSGTIVYVAREGKYLGHILISDSIKKDSKATIESLKKIGVHKTVMLTGDSKVIGEAVANELKIDKVNTELLPSDKVNAVEELLSEGTLAFIGDGINDAPVLTRADVGIAMGALGSDAAIEAADVVLMDDNPLKIPKAIKLSKKCMSIVYQNITFAIGIKLICLILGALGIADMWLAIFADVGVMVLAILNAIRAMNTKKIR